MAVTQALPAIPFELDFDARTLRGTLTRPDLAPPHPAVVLLPDPPGVAHGFDGLRDALTVPFITAGVATATFQRVDDTDTDAAPERLVDDAAGVIEHLAARDDVDGERLGLVACGAAAIVAGALIRRGAAIARLALIAATSGEALRQRAGRTNAASLLDVDETSLESFASLAAPADLAAHPPVTLVLHGAADRVVPPSEARPYINALEHTERPARHELVARGSHTLDDEVVRDVGIARLVEFFGRHADT